MESNRAQGKRTVMMNYSIKEEEEYDDDEEQEEQEEEDEDEEDLGSSVYGEDDSRRKRVITVNNTTTTSPSLSKRGSGAGGSTARPCCQADTCNADLSDEKQYYRRHKVCDFHSKAPAVVVAGHRQRFCQQCSRFHNLSEFDGTKRSCRRRLAGHNERRRKSSSADFHGEGSSG